MPTDAIVTTDDLFQARAQLRGDGLEKAMTALSQTEPEVFDFVLTATHCVAGRLALFEVQNRAVRDSADDMLETVLTVLMALRQGHARLWESSKPDHNPQI